MITVELKQRKDRLNSRLAALGLKTHAFTYLKYLDYSEIEFQLPYDIGCRIIVLYGLFHTVYNLRDRSNLVAWFKQEGLWEHVSPEEKEFLAKPEPEDRELARFSWGIEAILVLGWAVGLTDRLPEITGRATDEALDEIFSRVPELGAAKISEWLSGLAYRDLGEVFEENLVNEIATGYFRDLLFNSNPDETKIDREVSLQRHHALNWVRQFSGIKEWDDTDTST